MHRKNTTFQRIFTQPVMIAFWFAFALLITMAIGFLNTQQRYVPDLHLLLFSAAILLAVAWLMSLMLLPFYRGSLFAPLLGIVSFLSLLSDLADEGYFWAAFQWPLLWLDALLYACLAVLVLIMVRKLLSNSAITERTTPRGLWLLASMPFLFVLAWSFFSGHNYYADQHGRVPVFHHGLSAWTLPGNTVESIDTFLKIDNTNQK